MSYAEERQKLRPAFSDEARALAMEWRKLGRAATFVAVLTSPATFAYLTMRQGWPVGWALLVTVASVAAFRGLVDVVAHRFIPRASLYGAEQPLLEEDVVARRRGLRPQAGHRHPARRRGARRARPRPRARDHGAVRAERRTSLTPD